MKPGIVRATTDDTHLFVITLFSMAGFFSLFKLRNIGPLDFWWWFSAIILVLMLLVISSDREFLKKVATDVRNNTVKKILYGSISAVSLYFIFFTGSLLSRLIFAFADLRIAEIYGMKSGHSLWKIVPLLVFIIGPGEELFWRGFLQRRYTQTYGRVTGYILSVSFYTLIHAGSGNKILILAACIGGLFWGWLYLWKNSILLNMTSHTLWDIAVFIMFPFTG